MPTSGLPRCAAAFLLAVAGAAGCVEAAPDVRFVALRPGSEPGTWTAVLTGRGAKSPDKLAFAADGAAVEAVAAPAGGFVLRGVPEGAGTIAVGKRSGTAFEPWAAVRVGAEGGPSGALDDLTVYHVMVEMFRNGSKANDGEIRGWKHPNYAGGDLQGVIESLDHVRGLGANAIWLSPIFAARTSHGYDVLNYYRIADQVAVPGDPDASLALFRRLVAAAHERGIKIILDTPLNHASKSYELPQGDPEGLAPRATGPMQPAEKLWESWGGGYRYWNFDHAPTRKFLTDAALHWLTSEGVDGLRLDYVRGVPRDFWAELRSAVAKAKPGAYVVGECWADEQGADGNAREIATYYAEVPGKGRALDSLLDFPMQETLVGVFARGGSPALLESRLQSDDAAYGPGAHPTYFLDNHDLARFSSWAADRDRVAAAVTYLATLTGPIVVFYGTETGLSSGAPKPGFTDTGRVPMPWGALDEPLVARVRAALTARAEHPALRRGGRLPLAAEGGALVVAKTVPEETALVAVNPSDAPVEIAFDAGGVAPSGAVWSPVAGTASAPAPVEGGRLRWVLPPKSTSVAVAPRAVPAS